MICRTMMIGVIKSKKNKRLTKTLICIGMAEIFVLVSYLDNGGAP